MTPAIYDLWQRAQTVAAQHELSLPASARSLGNWHSMPAICKGAKDRTVAYVRDGHCVVLKCLFTGFKQTVTSTENDERRVTR